MTLNGDIGDYFKSFIGEVAGDKDLKTNTIVLAIKTLTGSSPIVDRSNPHVNVIKFTKSQRMKLESLVDSKKSSIGSKGLSKPSNVKIEHTSLWMPFAIKKALPYAIGFGAVAFMLGRLSK